MPELPEVEVVRRGLEPAVTGRRIDGVQVLHPRPVRRHAAGPDDFAASLTGRTFGVPRRRGKFLWLPFDDGDALLAHLGMSGQFRLDAPGAPLHVSSHAHGDELRFVVEDGGPGIAPEDRERVFHRGAARKQQHRGKQADAQERVEPLGAVT